MDMQVVIYSFCFQETKIGLFNGITAAYKLEER